MKAKQYLEVRSVSQRTSNKSVRTGPSGEPFREHGVLMSGQHIAE